jgi:glycine oxidase
MLSRARVQSDLGIRFAAMDRNELHDCVPLLCGDVVGALHYPDDAVVDPRDMMRGLRTACLARRVTIREGCAVDAIQLSGGSVELQAGAERITTRFAVLAAGAWSSQIAIFCGEDPVSIAESFPVRGHLLGYELAPKSLGPIVRHGKTYLVQRAKGLTIAGTSSERIGFDRTIDPAVVSNIAARAARLMPRLRAITQPVAWLGFRPAAGNLQPMIQRAGQSNLWLAYGHYRNGILLAPATAARISGQIIAS